MWDTPISNRYYIIGGFIVFIKISGLLRYNFFYILFPALIMMFYQIECFIDSLVELQEILINILRPIEEQS